jgi:hypothetical protein
MYYREWCLQPHHRRGCMLPLKTVAQFENAPDAGYASVYMFDADAAATIKDARSSSGLARYPVSADTLTLDLDKGEKQLELVESKIRGLAYKVYDSGGKGFHVVIKLSTMATGPNVPYSQRCWAEALGVGADLSLYQAGHIISLPGRKHPKTGRRKTLVREVAGEPLELLLTDPPERVFAISDSDQSELERGLWRLIGLLRQEPGAGNRHTALWSTAKHFADAGIEYDTALDLLTETNATWEEPKTIEDVEAAIRQAYGR